MRSRSTSKPGKRACASIRSDGMSGQISALPECVARHGEMVRCCNEAKLSALLRVPVAWGCLAASGSFLNTSDPPRVKSQVVWL